MYGGVGGRAGLALVLGLGILAGAAPAGAADLGGGCCADLEERIAELEATTARKGNRKVSLEISGHVNEAVARLKELEASDFPPVAVKASFARVEAELAAKTLKSPDAIETLEKLRFRWRGDDLELRILRKLGSLYFADARWREGLDVLRIASAPDLARPPKRRATNVTK